MEVIAIFAVLRRHVFLIVALSLVTMLAGYGISFFSPLIPEKYDAATTVLVRPHNQIKIQSNNSSKEFMDFPVAQTPVVETASKTYIQIIQSPALIGEVVRELGLDHKPEKTEAVADNIFAQLFASTKAFVKDIQPYVTDTIAYLRYGKVVRDDPFSKAVKDIGRGLLPKSYEDTYVFEIKYSDDDPQTAADVPNTIARMFIKTLEEIRSAEARGSADYLRRELEQSRQRLVAAHESLSNYKAERKIFLYQPEYDAQLKVISDLTVELAKLDGNLAARTLDAGTDEKKRARLLKTIEEKRAELAPLPTIERELRLRQADVDVANTTYETVAKELKDAEIMSQVTPEARVISPAAVPLVPSKPRREIFALVALLAGLMAGVGLAFFLEYINRTVRGVDAVEDFVGLKVIGTIPLVSRTMLLAAPEPSPAIRAAPDAGE